MFKLRDGMLPPEPGFGEVEGGTDIYPDSKGVWKIVEDQNIIVQAAPMVHTVPCVGYVVKEKVRIGRLKAEYVTPIVLRNREALREAGMADPNKIFRLLKALRPGWC